MSKLPPWHLEWQDGRKRPRRSLIKALFLCQMIRPKQRQWWLLEAKCQAQSSVRLLPRRGPRESAKEGTCFIYLFISSFQGTALWSDCHLHDVLSFDRWWVGLYHVWSTGNTGVFCGVAQVSQCGSLSARVRCFHFWASPLFLLLKMRQWKVVPNVCWCRLYETVQTQQQRLQLGLMSKKASLSRG